MDTPQDKRDANLSGRWRRAHGDEEAAKVDLRRKALAWISKEKAVNPLPQLKRLSAWIWLCQLDNALKVATGHGLADFLSQPPPQPKQRKRKRQEASSSSSATPAPMFVDQGKQLTLSIDQGPDGWSAVNWMLYKAKVRLVVLIDSNHRVWNDLKTSFSDAGLWTTVLLWGVFFNLNFGPYDGAAWWRVAQEGAEEYSRLASTDCPLLMFLLPLIASQMHDPEDLSDLSDPDFPRKVLEQLWTYRAYSVKGPMLQLSRWMSWLDCWAFWHRKVALRTLGLAYVGIDMGYMTHDPSSSQLQLVGMAKEMGPGTEYKASAAQHVKAV